ncbi:MAG: UDP-glucose 4-epimerase GalE [Oscillospiraceae bacterium]|nr:UDP-glucose 4-epimerase GalE [Oscillospiraceae bacterium]
MYNAIDKLPLGAKIEAKRIVVTGGAGYIGSHTCVELIKQGYEPIIVDNFCNSPITNIDAIEKITGVRPKVYEIDVTRNLSNIFKLSNIVAVIHFAGLKAVGESCEKPMEYLRVNVGGTINLLQHMQIANVKNIVFSSSATVYGDINNPPFTETMPLSAVNPYGTSKIMCEEIIKVACEYQGVRAAALRYFNPINAHDSGLLPEKPIGRPNNVFPIIEMSAQNRTIMSVFGNDYDTPDGTCIRDYIHVCDLALGHIKALEYLENVEDGSFEPINLGTGHGMSVLELIEGYKKAKNTDVFYEFAPRRQGDIASCYADVSKAKELLDWQTERAPI